MYTNTLSAHVENLFRSTYKSLLLIKRIWPLLLGHFTNDFYANILPAMLPIVLVTLDLTLAEVGFIASSFLTIGAFSQLFFGVISDRFPRIRFTLIGVGMTGVFFSLAGFASNYWFVVGMVTLAGIGSAMFHPKATAETGALAPEQRGLTISLFIACGTAGFSLAPIVSAVIYESLGLKEGSWLFLAMILVIFAFLTWAMPSSSQNSAKKQHIHWIAAMKILLIPWLIVVFRHAVYFNFMTYTIILLEERGLSYISSSLMLSFFLLAGVFGILAGGPLSDRYGRKSVTILSLMIALPALMMFLHTVGWISVVFLTLGGFSLIMNGPAIVAYAQEKLPQNASTASAITMGFGWGVGALMIGPVGTLADHWGIGIALNLVVASLAVAILLSFRLHSKAHHSENIPNLPIQEPIQAEQP